MDNLKAILGWIILAGVFGFYMYGIIYGIFFPEFVKSVNPLIPDAYKIPEPLDVLVKSMGAAMLANMAAILGFAIIQPAGPLATKVAFGQSREIIDPIKLRDRIQLWAAGAYGLILIGCFVAWLLQYSEKEVKLAVFVIANAKIFIAVLVGYVAFILSRVD
jgi:hypothetical protein